MENKITPGQSWSTEELMFVAKPADETFLPVVLLQEPLRRKTAVPFGSL